MRWTAVALMVAAAPALDASADAQEPPTASALLRAPETLTIAAERQAYERGAACTQTLRMPGRRPRPS